MAKKPEIRYVCSECGYFTFSPLGRCPKCGEWGSLQEERAAQVFGCVSGPSSPVSLLKIEKPPRISSSIEELDRVLGGGFVPGGVALLGGQPGIGKSTLLLQVCGKMASSGLKVLYVSGEESQSQVFERAFRLGAVSKDIDVLCSSDIKEALSFAEGHGFLVVDSVQAMKDQDETGWPGTPNQVRSTAQLCIDTAKSKGIPVVLVGHITKEGRIAGPMLLEHMVDTVLLFQGGDSAYRTLRVTKNRYGGTDEVGLFQMGEKGLSQVQDPACLYWDKGDQSVPGVALTAVLEGTRTLLAEVQALAASTSFAYPRRTSRGVSVNKLHLLLAVLQKRCGLSSSNLDVYLNVVGGMDLRDPGGDLAIALAVASSALDKALPQDCCVLGEVGLVGEIRPVGRIGQRLKEASRLGFNRAIVSFKEEETSNSMDVVKVRTLQEAMAKMGLRQV